MDTKGKYVEIVGDDGAFFCVEANTVSNRLSGLNTTSMYDNAKY